MANEIQRFYLRSAADPLAWSALISGSFRLAGFNGYYSNYIHYNDNAASVTAALEAFSDVGPGDVNVTDPDGDGFQYEFINGLADTPIDQFAVNDNTLRKNADTISVSIVDYGSNGSAEYHEISLNGANSGTFDLSWDGGTTTYSVDAGGTPLSDIQAAYDAQYGSGAFTVGDNGGGVFGANSVAPTASYGNTNPAVHNDATNGTGVSSSLVTSGANPESWQVQVWLPDEPDDGNLNLTVDGGTPTSNFAWNASSGAISSALSTVGVHLTADSGAGTTASKWVLTGPAELLTSFTAAEGSFALTGPCAVEVVTVQEGSSAGINADSPTVLIDFLGVAPDTSKSFASGQGSIDFTAIAPLFALTAVSGQGLIDLAATQPASSKASTQPAALLDFLAPALTETITAPSPVVIVAIATTQPATAKSAAQPVALLDISAVALGSQHTAAAEPSLMDFASVAALADKAAVVSPGLLEVTSPALTESLVGDSGIVLIDFAAVAPSVSRTAELGAAILCLTPLAPSVYKAASIAVAAIEFVATEIIAAYGLGFTVIAAHFFTLEPAAIDSLELTKASQAMSLDPAKASAFTLDTYITQAFSGDTRRVDAP